MATKKKTTRAVPRVPEEPCVDENLHVGKAAADVFDEAEERERESGPFETVQWVYGMNFRTHSAKNIYTFAQTIEPQNAFMLEEVRIGGSGHLIKHLSKVEVVVGAKVYLDCVAVPFVRAIIEPKPELKDIEGPARLFFNVPLAFSFKFTEGVYIHTAVMFQVRAFVDDLYAGREGRLAVAAVGWKRRPLV